MYEAVEVRVMVYRLCASCSFESSLLLLRTLLVTIGSDQIASLHCFDGSRTESLTSPVKADTTRVLSSWFAGNNTFFYPLDVQALAITCLSTPQLFSIFVVYTNPEGAFCRRFSYDSDLLEKECSEPTSCSIIEGKSGFSLKVRAMSLLQCSRRVLFVTNDETIFLSPPLDSIVRDSGAGDQSNSSNIPSQTFLPHFLLCSKLPSLTCSNKTLKSLRADETVIGSVYSVENSVESDAQADIVFIVQSESWQSADLYDVRNVCAINWLV